jgi:hypothetical protein
MSAHVMFKPGLPHLNLMNQPVFPRICGEGKTIWPNSLRCLKSSPESMCDYLCCYWSRGPVEKTARYHDKNVQQALNMSAAKAGYSLFAHGSHFHYSESPDCIDEGTSTGNG